MPNFVTAEGLEIPTVEDLLLEIATEQRGEIDPLLANDPESLIGELNGIVASHQREAWEVLQYAFNALNPDNAEDAILDGVSAFTGTKRDPAKKSRFAGTRKISVNLEPGAVVTKGVTAFSDGNPAHVFFADETLENTTAVADDFLIAAVAETAGPTAINSGTLTTIVTPTTGLNSVINPFDAVIGSAVESNQDLRVRREDEVAQQGGSTIPGLAADLLALENDEGEHPIISVEILENTLDIWDPVTGLSPHSFEPIVWDGPANAALDEDIARTIYENRTAGATNRGTTVVSGIAARFTRPTQRAVTMTITLRKTTGYAGDTAVKAAVAAAFQAKQIPRADAPYSVYSAVALGVAGVTRITSITWSLPSGPTVTNTDLSVGVRDVATTDTSLITIVATDE